MGIMFVTETLTNQSWGRSVQQHLACCEGSIDPSSKATNKIRLIKCLQEELAFVSGWYVHVTPAASKEIRIILTHFTSMNLSETYGGKKIDPHM